MDKKQKKKNPIDLIIASLRLPVPLLSIFIRDHIGLGARIIHWVALLSILSSFAILPRGIMLDTRGAANGGALFIICPSVGVLKWRTVRFHHEKDDSIHTNQKCSFASVDSPVDVKTTGVMPFQFNIISIQKRASVHKILYNHSFLTFRVRAPPVLQN